MTAAGGVDDDGVAGEATMSSTHRSAVTSHSFTDGSAWAVTASRPACWFQSKVQGGW